MSLLWRWVKRLVVALLVVVVVLVAPVGGVELMCRGKPAHDGYEPVVAAEWRRPEGRTFTTYPEWAIVYAYQDYAEVIRTGDPQDFGYFRAVAGFWQSLCPLARQAAAHGGFDGASKATIYTIGVSFGLEMALKAAYEETVGRVATWVRGPQRAPLDDLSARQAADYATFLHQVPWYRWDFRAQAAELDAASTGVFRDRERDWALGIEYRGKAAYAAAIAQAVEGVGHDELRMRSVVDFMAMPLLDGIEGVTVVGQSVEGIEIETDRYAAFTELAKKLAAEGVEFVEIAGNDEILITVLTDRPSGGALYAVQRQGFGDWRELRLVPVRDLSAVLRDLAQGPDRLEHIHDY